MSIERSRNRMRPPGPVTPRPDGMSRRVATAARDRRPGPLPEQRPTGWHRVVYDNPMPPARPADPPRDVPPALIPAVVRAPVGPRPPSGGGHQQVGRVLGPPPAGRTRRAALVLVATVGAAAAAGMAAVVLVAGSSEPDRIGPEAPATVAPIHSTGASLPSNGSTGTGPGAPSSASAPDAIPPAGPVGTTGAEDTGTAPTDAADSGPETGPDPAQVTTLVPGAPGFGWPSTAFGSGAPDG
ncbi:hypothetical protein [Nakamurella sp.]|uniref:hypothetical protein n=1 Tax=Nakamurella sp. TaxID=1869182 RepID=UPI003B3AE68D